MLSALQYAVWVSELVASLEIQGAEIGERKVPGFLVDAQVLVLFSVGKEGNSACMFARMISYLRWTGIEIGILVNIGRRVVQLRAVDS